MHLKSIIPLYLFSIFGTLATSIVIPILPDLDTNYGLFQLSFFNFSLKLSMGGVEALFVFIATVSLFYWGYTVDKNNRKKIFIIGLLIFMVGVIIILLQTTRIEYYILGRCVFMAIGLGALGPAFASYAGDILTFEKRSTLNSTLSVTGIGGLGIGILISSIFSGIYLFLPFLILLVISIFLVIVIYFYPEPIRGGEEPEIRDVLEKNGRTTEKIREIEESYSQNISIDSIKMLITRKTNLYVLIQGFFALFPSIIFSYYLISYLHDNQHGGVGLQLQFAVLLALGSASGRIVGFPFFGWLGDKLHFSNNEMLHNKGRAIVPLVTMFIQAPIYMIAFIISLPQLYGTQQIFPTFIYQNEQFIIFGILFFIGSFVGAGSGPNRNSIVYDVNEPELRGQTSSILAIGDQFGASVALLIGNVLIIAYSYTFAFIVLTLGYVISGFFWIGVYKNIVRDEEDLRLKIEKRIKKLDNSQSG